MSYPSQKRRRGGRGVAALVVALLAGGAGLATMPSAQAVPSVPGPAGTIQTMGGITRNYQQGGYGPEGVNAKESQFQNPRGLAFAPNGDLYVTDALNNRVRKIDANGIVSLVAGNGTVCTSDVPAPCYTGDGGPAINATLNEPHGVAVDSEGIVYIADSKNCVIRKIDSAGIISTYAGTGQRNPANPKACAKTDGTPDGPVLTVALDQPKSLFMTRQAGDDTLYIADFGNSQIRMIDVDSATPENKRVAGTSRSRHYGVGAGFDAKDSEFRHPESVWVAPDGTIYVSDGGNNLIRKIAMPATPNGIRKVSVIAGDAAAAQANAQLPNDLDGNSDGDGGPASAAHLDKPRGITGDLAGNLYVAEEHGSRIRRINLNTGLINTIAGDGSILDQRINGGSLAIKGDPEGNALEAQFAMLHDIQIAPDGALWIADSRNNRVRAMADVANAPGAVIPTGGLTPPPPPPSGCTSNCPAPGKSGYWMLGEDGKVFAFGDATVMGDTVGRMGGAKAVHIEPTPNYGGYWINDDRGNVYGFGNAAHLGNASGLLAGEKVTSLSGTPSGAGYWLFTSKGRVFNFGDAGKFGDLAAITLNGPIQSSIPTPSGKGYFMVGSDGGVFAFGDAVFRGSMGATKLNQPVMALVPTSTSQGYWLVASDGGIFAFGDAKFRGSMGATKLNKPVVGMVRYGAGYLMVGADGGIFSFSDKPFVGSLGANPPARPITFAATLDT